jgi:hypothetical protein
MSPKPGLMGAAFKWLTFFIGSQALVIALGLLPLSLWRSFRTGPIVPLADQPASGGTAAPAESSA